MKEDGRGERTMRSKAGGGEQHPMEEQQTGWSSVT